MNTIPELQALRVKLDQIDADLIQLLANRFEVTKSVGLLKKKLNLPSVDKSRETAQFEKIKSLAAIAGVNEELAAQILRAIIDQVVKDHNDIANSEISPN